MKNGQFKARLQCTSRQWEYLCNYVKTVTKETKNGYTHTTDIYQCHNCEGCPLREKCTKAKEGRTVQRNEKRLAHRGLSLKIIKKTRNMVSSVKHSPLYSTKYMDVLRWTNNAVDAPYIFKRTSRERQTAAPCLFAASFYRRAPVNQVVLGRGKFYAALFGILPWWF